MDGWTTDVNAMTVALVSKHKQSKKVLTPLDLFLTSVPEDSGNSKFDGI